MINYVLEKKILEKSKLIHGDRWIYHGFEIIKNEKRNRYYIKLECKIHGKFKQRTDSHLKGAICRKCKDDKYYKASISYENFILKSNEIHDNKYEYPEQEFSKRCQKIKIICKDHGEFCQEANNHINGSGCPKCGKITISKKLKNSKDDIEDILKRVYANNKNIEIKNCCYKDSRSKINLFCKKHGIIIMFYYTALKGNGCKYCNEEDRIKQCEKDFIELSREIWGDKYNYSDFKGWTKKVKIEYDGKFYFQHPYNHIKGFLPFKNISGGEYKIKSIFEKKEYLSYITQKTFYDLKFIKKLRFDFYLPKLSVCIEFNGIQHYKSIEHWGGDKRFEHIKKCDDIKKKYCEKNNIKLIIISYLDFYNIEKILNELLNEL